MSGLTVERDGDAVVVKIPMLLKKRAGRKEVIVPQGLQEKPRAAAQEPLVVALARAFHWQGLLDTGKYTTMTDLADALGVDRRYVGRILVLATLAPDIVEAIVAGTEPSGLSLEVLGKGVPLGWKEQRQLLLVPCVAGT